MAVLVIIKRMKVVIGSESASRQHQSRTGIYLSQRLVEETSWSEVIAEGIDLV
jgi:hypothetical protein